MSASVTGGTSTTVHAGHSKELNEFAGIQGLGPAMQQWLRESFNVRTVADLANLSVHQMLSRLQDEEQAFCRHEIECWIQQAQQVVAEQTSWRTFATFVVSLQTREGCGQTEQRTTAYFLEADRKKIWSGIECNGVYELMLDQLKHVFQLQPEVNISMEPESQFESEPIDERPSEQEPASASEEVAQESALEAEPTIEPEAVAVGQSEPESISEGVDVAVELSEPESHATVPVELIDSEEPLELTPDAALEPEITSEPEVVVSEPLTLEITQLKFWQSSEAEESEKEGSEMKKPETEEGKSEKAIVVNMGRRSLPAMLYNEKPFELEVSFQILGTGSVDLTREPIPYHVQCFIQNRETRERVQPESRSSSTLTEGQLSYTTRLPEAILQQPGAYRFQIVTQLDGGHASPDVFELPFVQVV